MHYWQHALFLSCFVLPGLGGVARAHPGALERPAGGNSPAARDETPFAEPGDWGPFGVGVIQLLVPARHQDEPLVTLLWYPADVDPDDDPYVYIDTPEFAGPLSGVAIEDAPVWPVWEPFPAIAFSHGNGGMSYQSIFLTEHLASHGYVVIACDHPGDTMFDFDPKSMVTGAITRPLDISALIDELYRLDHEPNGTFDGRIDMDRIGMTGHSYGGYTTLAISGAQLNFNLPEARCAAGDPDACLFVQTARDLGVWDRMLDLSDRRVRASAPLAPLGWEPFRAEGLSYIDIPIQIHGGGLDESCPMETEVEPVWIYAQEPKAILEIFDAGHYAYSDICLALPDDEECFPPYIDMDVAHEIINTWVTSHFKVFLDNDMRYASYLTAEYAETWASEAYWREALNL